MKKTIFITGATSGFGEAYAMLFAGKGCNLVLIEGQRRGERLKKLQNELPAEFHVIVQDVRNREAVREDIANLPDGFTGIDVLINNAGLSKLWSFQNLSGPWLRKSR